jgi:hypothetical protein
MIPKLNRNAKISKKALEELIRIGAIKKNSVDQGDIKVGELYSNIFRFPDIYELAEEKHSVIIMTELTSF